MTLLVEALRAANLAGIVGDSEGLIRPLDDDEADVRTLVIHDKAVQQAVADLAHWNADGGVFECHLRRRGKRGLRALVDEFRRDQQDEHAGCCTRSNHPESFAARGPLGFAEGGAFESRGLRRATSPRFEKHHGGGERQNCNEEEHIVIHDRADDCHFTAAAGQNLALGEFVQARDGELRNHHHQDDRGDTKELAEVDADGATHKADAEQDREGNSGDGAQGFEHAGRIETERGEQENRFDTFAEDHQKDEGEDPPGAAARRRTFLQASFNFAADVRAVAVHPDDH